MLLTPSILNQLGSALYPMPSRSLMLKDMRSLKAEVTKKQDEILDNFLRDHPEYALNDSTQARTFYHRYMASQKLIKEELLPIVTVYEEQLQKQQDWIGQFKWISPAIIVQESLNQIAGTSTSDYEAYRKQVIRFSEDWRAHFMPYLYNNITFAKKDVEKLPTFSYQQTEQSSFAPLALVLIAIGLFGLGFFVSNKSKSNIIIKKFKL